MESTIDVIGCMNLPYKYVKDMNAIFLGESSYFKMPMSKGKIKKILDLKCFPITIRKLFYFSSSPQDCV